MPPGEQTDRVITSANGTLSLGFEVSSILFPCFCYLQGNHSRVGNKVEEGVGVGENLLQQLCDVCPQLVSFQRDVKDDESPLLNKEVKLFLQNPRKCCLLVRLIILLKE